LGEVTPKALTTEGPARLKGNIFCPFSRPTSTRRESEPVTTDHNMKQTNAGGTAGSIIAKIYG